MPSFKDFAALEGYIKQQIDSVLGAEVAKIAMETESMMVDQVVYDSYSPSVYSRRGDGGGLGSTDNMQAQVKNGELVLSNKTQFNPGCETKNKGTGLAELVEYGDGGGGHHYDYPIGSFTSPRPFIQSTKETLSGGGFAVDAMRIGLKARGLDVN